MGLIGLIKNWVGGDGWERDDVLEVVEWKLGGKEELGFTALQYHSKKTLYYYTAYGKAVPFFLTFRVFF